MHYRRNHFLLESSGGYHTSQLHIYKSIQFVGLLLLPVKGRVTHLYWFTIMITQWWSPVFKSFALRWRHNGRDSVSHHQPHDCLLNHLFRRRSKKTSKVRVTGLCAGNSPGTGEYPAQMASNAENVSIWWRHHVASMCETNVHPDIHFGFTVTMIHGSALTFLYHTDVTWTLRCLKQPLTWQWLLVQKLVQVERNHQSSAILTLSEENPFADR